MAAYRGTMTRPSGDQTASRKHQGKGRTPLRSARTRRRDGMSGPALLSILCLGLLIGWDAPVWMSRVEQPGATPLSIDTAHPGSQADPLSADFGFCHSGGGTNCVVDGDSFWFRGDKYRIADIDTPETHGPRCDAEAALGRQATQRLQVLLNDGAFSLEGGERETDRYGRALRIVMRNGRSIGGMLVAEGLAREWDAARHPWC